MVFRHSFADEPLRASRLPSFRAEHFSCSGPFPWLDREDALEQVESRLGRQEINPDQAALCCQWAADGYVILNNLIENQTLDEIWAAYEKAIASGKIKLPREPAGESDPFPGRFLNPHKKIGAFCRILKHPGLLSLIRLLIGREPKPLQTIAAHKGSQQGLHSDSIHMTTYPLGVPDRRPDCVRRH